MAMIETQKTVQFGSKLLTVFKEHDAKEGITHFAIQIDGGPGEFAHTDIADEDAAAIAAFLSVCAPEKEKDHDGNL